MGRLKKFYRKNIFPIVVQCLDNKYIGEIRERVLEGVQGKCLEIGIGTGVSLRHYPVHLTELYAIEPNEGMHELCKGEAAKQGIQLNLWGLEGENLPFEEETFDTVIVNFVLCSIPNYERVLKEIYRVLKTGGQFIFVEHGISENEHYAKMQHLLNPVFNVFAAGCNVDRNYTENIKKRGFKSLEIRKYTSKGMPIFADYIYEGKAIK